jgi:hypothetical protein
MPSSAKASLLDDGVVDTLGSVGAASGVHTSISISERAAILSKSPPSRRRPTRRYDGRSPIDWRILVSQSVPGPQLLSALQGSNGNKQQPKRAGGNRLRTSHFDKYGSQPFAKRERLYACFLAVFAAPQKRTRVDAIGIDFQHRAVELARGRGCCVQAIEIAKILPRLGNNAGIIVVVRHLVPSDHGFRFQALKLVERGKVT